MNKLNKIDMELLSTVADIKDIPQGAINIRSNGQAILRKSTPNITISSMLDKPGMRASRQGV